MLRYSLYLLSGSVFFAWLYSLESYTGRFSISIFLVIGFMVFLSLGEFLKARSWNGKRHIILGGTASLLILFLGGHFIAFINDGVNSTFGEYFNSLMEKGFLETRRFDWVRVEGIWVFFAWVNQLVWFGFAVWATWKFTNIDPVANWSFQGKRKITPHSKTAAFRVAHSPKTQELQKSKSAIDPEFRDELGMPHLFSLIADREDIHKIEMLMEKGIDPSLCDFQGNTFLHFVGRAREASYGYVQRSDRPVFYSEAEARRLEVLATRLIKKGAEVDKLNKEGITPVMLFARNSSFPFFKWIIEKNPDINIKDKLGRTVLMYAAMGGDSQLQHLELLLKADANPDAKDVNGRRAINYAARKAAGTLVQKLLEEADQSEKNETLTHLLPDAVFSREVGFAKQLFVWGADPSKLKEDTQNLLSRAIADRDLEMVELLLDFGLSPNANDHESQTPTMYAAGCGSLEILKIVIDAGGDIRQVSNKGTTTLSAATAAFWREGLQYLVGHGADPKVAPDGFNLLMRLAFSLHLVEASAGKTTEMLDFLSDFEIDVNQTDNLGRTALCYVCGCNNSSSFRETDAMVTMAEFLLNRGADPFIGCGDRQTPVELAQRNNLVRIQKLMDAV